MAFLFWLSLVLFLFISVMMILLVLIQKGRGGGLASAFGGAGGNTAFGSKTGDVLTWATSVVFGVFLLLAVVVNLLSDSLEKRARAGTTASVTAAAQLPMSPSPAAPVGPTTAPR